MLNINGATLYDIEEASCEKVYKMHNNQLFDATVTALETGNLSPLVKEELKYTIQSRRRAKGQRELKVDFPEQAKYELTKEEKIKIERRREQNRLAAHKFRQKKKECGNSLCKKIQALESDNVAKRAEIRKLRDEKIHLQKMLQNHLLVCHRVYKP